MELTQRLSAILFLAILTPGLLLTTEMSSDAFPVIDGKIEEAEWAAAKVFSDFHLVVPRSEEKFYDSTLVYVRQSSDALYFAFKFYPKSKVLRQSLIRDASSDEENEFFIVLDLENRNENGYIFIFNFIDNQRDMAVYNQRSLTFEWDWVWQVRSTVYREATDTEPGYIETEVKIPVDKIQNKNREQIGIDLQLFAYKQDGSSYFYALTPQSEILTVKSTYKLDIEPFEESLTPSITAIPFVVASKVQSDPSIGTAGGDLNLSLDRHKLKATYNTDESTLEADPFQFSLYGQSIYLQEKRPFLSKDLDIYRTPINLFYSRAIQEIQWGGNYTFRSNAVKAGVVSVQDELDSDGDGISERRHLTVLRSNWNQESVTLGTTLLYGRNSDTRAVERAASFDARVELPLGFRLQPQWATNGDGHAYQMQISLPRNWAGGPYGAALYRRFGDGFNISTLFNDYGTNYDEIYVESGYRDVSNRSLFSQMEFNASYYRARTLDAGFMYQEYVSLFASNQVLEFLNVSHRFELNRPDDFTPTGIVERRNVLQDHSAKVLVGPHAFTIGYNFGSYFGTYLKNPYANMRIIFWDRLAWDVTLNNRSYAEVRQTIIRVKMDVRLLERLYFRSFVQKDNYFKRGLWNTLLQYEFFAGSSVYLVLNQEGERFQNSGKFFKVGYEVNF